MAASHVLWGVDALSGTVREGSAGTSITMDDSSGVTGASRDHCGRSGLRGEKPQNFLRKSCLEWHV
jgi:hypothetical protein